MIERAKDLASLVTELLLGGRAEEQQCPLAQNAKPPYHRLSQSDVFTDVVVLPANDVREAHSAISLQLDRLLPSEPSETAWDIVPLDQLSSSPGRRRFLLVAASHRLLNKIRDSSDNRRSRIEAFVYPIAQGETSASAILVDPRGTKTRRDRRTIQVLAWMLLFGAMLYLAFALNAFSDAQLRMTSDRLKHEAAQAAEASQRTLNASQALAELKSKEAGDAINAILSRYGAIVGLSKHGPIDRIEVTARTIEGVAISKNVQDFQTALEGVQGLRVLTVATTADPFNRGTQITFVAELVEQ